MRKIENKKMVLRLMTISTLGFIALWAQAYNAFADDTAVGTSSGSSVTTLTWTEVKPSIDADRNKDGKVDAFEECAFVKNLPEDQCRASVQPTTDATTVTTDIQKQKDVLIQEYQKVVEEMKQAKAAWDQTKVNELTKRMIEITQKINSLQTNNTNPITSTWTTVINPNDPDRNHDGKIDEFEKCAFVEKNWEEKCRSLINQNNGDLNNNADFNAQLEPLKKEYLLLVEELKKAKEAWDKTKVEELNKKLVEVSKKVNELRKTFNQDKKEEIKNSKEEVKKDVKDLKEEKKNDKQALKDDMKNKRDILKKKLSEKSVSRLDSIIDAMTWEKKTELVNSLIVKIDALIEKADNQKKKEILQAFRDYLKSKLNAGNVTEDSILEEILK